MKYLILVLLLAGCGVELETDVPKSVDVEVIPAPEIKIINKQVFLRIDGYCIAIDQTISTDWVSVAVVDELRGDYSSTEKWQCKH